jgi:hypothetical protein
MKTNQMMTVKIGSFGTLDIGHKTKMGSLDDILAMGNTVRIAKGKQPKELKTWLRMDTTWEFIVKVYNEEVKSSVSIGTTLLESETLKDLPRTESDGKISYSQIFKTKVFKDIIHQQTRGSLANRGTKAHLYILLDLAIWLDVDLKYEMYRCFIEDQILEYRDSGGDMFKELNKAIDTLPDRHPELKPNGNKGCYINVSKMLRTKLELAGKGYNGEEYDSIIQKLRDDYESQLVMLINAKYVNSYQELKLAIGRI